MFKCTVALHIILIFNENIMKLSERSMVVAESNSMFQYSTCRCKILDKVIDQMHYLTL